MHTVQILVEDGGNREVLSGFLDDRCEILTANEVQQADAYLVEDSVYSDYQEDLQQMVQSERPVFRPVILIQGANSRATRPQLEAVKGGANSIIVDIIEAPVQAPVLRRRLASLLGRREQSQELQQKMDQVERQRDALGVLNRMIRHDIRNDMQLVLGYAHELSDYVPEEDSEVLDAVVASTKEAIELTKETQDLTDLLLTEDSETWSIRLGEVVEEQIAAAQESNPAVSIDYQRPKTDLTVTGDKMLSSVVRNLVTNAIQHNDAESPKITVSITEIGESVRLSVADNGSGIPDSEKEDIFNRGVIGDESSGTGIGLFLVSAIVDRYGGEAHVEDSESNGAKFVVELPIAE